MGNHQVVIDISLVHHLIETQFPQWKDLPIRPVSLSGWDNRTFHLGDLMLVRMPSSSEYAMQVEKEQKWLPKLAPFLPLPIPEPKAIGEPGNGYPWKWSIYGFIEGDSAAFSEIIDFGAFAKDLAKFLSALQNINSENGPLAGAHSFGRGGDLAVYDSEVRKAISVLNGKIDVDALVKIWEEALATSWEGLPVWIHGDISLGNLLVREGRLCGVIDFGQMAVGDPSCDLAIAWTFFTGESRKVFRKNLNLDAGTWVRGRAWALWKSLIVAAGFVNPNNAESVRCWCVINEILADYME